MMNNFFGHPNANCVNCGGPMMQGTISLGQTESLNPLAAITPPKLFFHTDSDQKINILGSQSFYSRAYRCPQCGMVVFQGLRD